MRERSRIFGKYVRENISEKFRYLIDKIISPYFLRQFLVLIDMICGFMEGIEGYDQLITLSTVKDKEVQIEDNNCTTQTCSSINIENNGLNNQIIDNLAIEEKSISDERSISDGKSISDERSISDGRSVSDNKLTSTDKFQTDKMFTDKLFTDDKSFFVDSQISKIDESDSTHNELTSQNHINPKSIEHNNELQDQTPKNDATSLSNASDASQISNPQRYALTDDIVPIDNSTTVNALPLNIKSDDQEFIKQSLMLNNIKKKMAEVSIDLSDDESDNGSNDNMSNHSTDDRTNRFIETSEPTAKKRVRINPIATNRNNSSKTKTSIERKGKKLQISIKRD